MSWKPTATIRESTFRANSLCWWDKLQLTFCTDFRNRPGFHAAVWTQGKLAAKVTEPISSPPRSQRRRPLQHPLLLPAPYFNSHHSTTLSVCVRVKVIWGQCSTYFVQSLVWWHLPKNWCHSWDAWLRRKRWLAEVDLAFISCKPLVQNQYG